MASVGLIIQGLEQLSQRYFDRGIHCAQHPVFGFVDRRCGINIRAPALGVDQPNIRHAECQILVDFRAYPEHAILGRQDFDGDEGWTAEYRIVRYRLEVHADIGNPILARGNADALPG